MSRLTSGTIENTHIEDEMTKEELVEEVTVEEPIEESEEEESIKTIPVIEEPKTVPTNVINLDMSDATRTKIWVNGDCQKVLELNLTDMGILPRFTEAYPKLLALQDDVRKIIDDGEPENMKTMEELSEFASKFKSIDKQMRDYVDQIFDFKVCDVCCDGGSMYDPVGGGFWRFEYIINKIGKLYNVQFDKEMKANDKRMKMHTERYTGKAKYTKSRKSRK